MSKRMVGLTATGVLLEVIWIAVCSLGPLREHTIAFLLLIFSAFALCLVAYFRFRIETKRAVWLMLGFALLFRATMLVAPPWQSEDVYRYLWDARVSSMGLGPYLAPPESPELKPARDNRVYPMINSKPYVTAYPPLSQILFRSSVRLFGENVTAMKAVFSLLEFLALLTAWRLLVLWKRALQPLLLMAWHPFFVFEFSASGHSDSAMMFLALLAIYLLSRGKKTWSMVAYAGAVMAKLHPALWLPLFLRRFGKTGVKPALAGAATGMALLLLYFNVESLVRYINSLRLYFQLFEFNASLHYLIRFIGRWGFQESWDKEIGPYLGAILFLITVLVAWKFPMRDARDLLHAAFWLMTADLLLATTVHPWYISWAAVALPIFPYAFMVYWTGACFLSYLAYTYHPVYEPGWVLLVEYIPVYGLMAFELWKRRPLMEWLLQPGQAPSSGTGGTGEKGISGAAS